MFLATFLILFLWWHLLRGTARNIPFWSLLSWFQFFCLELAATLYSWFRSKLNSVHSIALLLIPPVQLVPPSPVGIPPTWTTFIISTIWRSIRSSVAVSLAGVADALIDDALDGGAFDSWDLVTVCCICWGWSYSIHGPWWTWGCIWDWKCINWGLE